MIKIILFLISFNLNAQVKLAPLYNHTQEEKQFVEISESLINKLVQSKCFESFMVNRELIDTNGKTPKQVVDHLRSLNGSVPIHMYYSRKNVVGYRNPSYPDVYTNRRFHAGSNACDRASNLGHEVVGHSLGEYDHSYKATYSRPRSVPYSINAAFKACCSCNGMKDCKIKDESPIVLPDIKPEPKYTLICKRKWYTLWIGKRCYKKYE